MKSNQIKPKSDCIYHVPISLVPIGYHFPNQFENGVYNLISVWINSIRKNMSVFVVDALAGGKSVLLAASKAASADTEISALFLSPSKPFLASSGAATLYSSIPYCFRVSEGVQGALHLAPHDTERCQTV